MRKVLFAVLMLLPALAWADFTVNGITYYVMDSQLKTVEVTNITQTGDVVIPASVNGYSVKRIGMFGNSGITSITIPSSVDYFVEDAFSGFTGLTAVKINDLTAWCKIHMTLGGTGSYTDSYSSNPLRFGHNLYLNNQLVTSVIVPATITDLGNGIFEGASCLTSVTLQTTLKSIGECCFQDCTGLTEITIPNNVKTIGRRAFRGCSNLETVTIGSSVESISYLVFDGCTKLSQIVCEAATPPTLGSTVFSDNTLNFTTLVVPKGKKTVYQNADGWSNFQKIVEVGDEGYQFMNSGARYQVINGTTSPYTCMLVNGNYTSNDVNIPTAVYDSKTGKNYNVTTIGEFAFSGVKGTMTSVTIPATVTEIKTDAFYTSPALTRVNITDLTAFCNMEVGDGTTIINNHPTYYSHSLYLNNQEIIDLSIPSGVTEIKAGTFVNCSNFKTVSIPASVNYIGMFSFVGCSSLQTITMASTTPPDLYAGAEGQSPFDSDAYSKITVIVPKGALTAYRGNAKWDKFTNIVELWGVGYPFESGGINYVIQENNTLAVVPKAGGYSGNINFPITLYQNNIPYTITTFDVNAFAGCTNMTSISIPATLTRIKEGAFEGCTGLTVVYISDLVAFCNIVVEDNKTAVDNHPTFYAKHLNLNGKEIRDLVIPNDNNVTDIKTGTFAGLTSLTSVTIPGRVTTIGISAFAGCSGLKSAIIPSSVTFIGAGAFQNCSSLTKIVSLRGSAPDCGYEPFYGIDKNKCVLWVPRDSKTNYTGANYWNSFLYTNELIMGDANVDGVVNAADIVEAINAKNNAPSPRFIQYNVDQTGNGVDASDINAIVNKAMQK